ncbi:uncharacterized protein LOC120185755 [Hibiscus syriacus]|uniref:uncharacterized protein LOC120185755 n=1 Tax=Hibiscus syriacus TaxID=106335 RepID=UPI0019240487|nr:uncharacterized protein LOC120185755 [Hibiscus syriacus]
MEGGDHWRMLNCSWGAHDNTITNRVMLRFRPIAPKPMTGDSDPGGSKFSSNNSVLTSRRPKRKYVRVCERNNRKKRTLDEAKEDKDENKGFVTLQLMPEKADLRESLFVERSWGVSKDDPDRAFGLDNYRFKDPPSLCLTLKKMISAGHAGFSLSDPGRTRRRMKLVESSLMVESVMETCIDDGGMENLEEDTCPGFISDGFNRVQWVNRAYERMLTVGKGPKEWLPPVSPPEIKVWLVIKKDLPNFCTAFSCKVRLQFTWLNKSSTIMLPCDVWKMDGPSGGHGGFAWRLDIEAALSLGLSR